MVVITMSGCTSGPSVTSATTPIHKATSAFEGVVGDIGALKSGLAATVSDANEVLASTNGQELTDPKLLDDLKREVAAAASLSTTVPVIAADAAAITAQVEGLKAQHAALKARSASLERALDAVATNKTAKLQEAASARDSHTITVTDSNGYKQKITVNIGSWIRGTKTDLLETAWQGVGGKGTMPLTGRYSRSAAMLTEAEFTANDAAYLFGTLTIENLTTDFDASGFNNGNSWVYLKARSGNGGGDLSLTSGELVKGVQYDNDTDVSILSFGPFVKANMTSDQWGPVPFVIGADTVFTPKYPEGNPTLSEATFLLYGGANFGSRVDSGFKVGKTW